jgi:heme iron utilization protein
MSDARTGDTPTATPVQDARALLRAARAGTLATSAAGQPFASLVTPATAPDGSVLMLLSGLSEHTRHLRDEPRCAVMVAGPPAGLNPQTAPRLTVTGLAAHEPDPAMKARWVALHPYAAFYAGFADFQVYRLRPVAGQFIGGFASATRLRQADLQWDPGAVAAIAAAEADVIGHCNADHPDALDAIAAAAGADGPGWLMAACDVDGCDLVRDESTLRIAWSASVQDAGGIRTQLVRLAHAARKRAAVGLDGGHPVA